MLIFFVPELYISLDQPSCMLENLLVYSAVGFSICYIALEIEKENDLPQRTI